MRPVCIVKEEIPGQPSKTWRLLLREKTIKKALVVWWPGWFHCRQLWFRSGNKCLFIDDVVLISDCI
ncbi:hypothetical protein V3F56_10160 [Moorellaceae bacterium AZ2]